jgi:hypothetical protein
MRALRPFLAGTVVLSLTAILGPHPLMAQSDESTPSGEPCEHAKRPFDLGDLHLTGAWDSHDGGIYYIRQIDDRIIWQGLSDAGALSDLEPGRVWTNVAMGTIDETGLITLDWADVPRGNILGSGTLTLQAGPDVDGNLQLRVIDETGPFTDMAALRGWHARGETRGQLLAPCAPATRSTSSFRPAFSFRDEAAVGLESFDLGRVVEMSAGDHAGVESGVTVWSVSPAAAKTCGAPGPKLEPGADAFLAWLRSREDLRVSEPVDVTVAGQPATMVDLTPAPGAKACLGNFDRVRLWQVVGADASVFTDSMARVILMDVDDSTLAIEMYGDDQDAWLPLAQRIVDTIQLTEY